MPNTLFVLGAGRIKEANYAGANDAIKAAMEKYESVASVCSGNSSTNSAEALSMCVKGIANCQQHLGFAYLQLRQYVEAQEALEHAVQLYQKLEDQVGQANSLHSVSTFQVQWLNQIHTLTNLYLTLSTLPSSWGSCISSS